MKNLRDLNDEQKEHLFNEVVKGLRSGFTPRNVFEVQGVLYEHGTISKLFSEFSKDSYRVFYGKNYRLYDVECILKANKNGRSKKDLRDLIVHFFDNFWAFKSRCKRLGIEINEEVYITIRNPRILEGKEGVICHIQDFYRKGPFITNKEVIVKTGYPANLVDEALKEFKSSLVEDPKEMSKFVDDLLEQDNIKSLLVTFFGKKFTQKRY